MKKFIFAVMMMFAMAAHAADVAFTVGTVDSRISNQSGSVVQIATQSGDMGYALQSLTIANANRTEADVSYNLIEAAGFTGTIGAGLVTQTGVQTHPVYFGKVGYVYDFGNQWSAGANLGYKNDFQRVVNDRQVTYGVDVGYLVTPKTTIVGAFTRYNGDLPLNTLSLTCVTKF